MFIFKIISIFIVLFTMGVLIVKFCKGCSIREATVICRDSVKNFLGELLTTLLEPVPAPPQLYPVLVGWDGYRIQPQFVDAEFSAVRADFASCYCTNAVLSKDNALVVYRFDIMRKPGGLDDDVLGELVQKQTEEVLANTMRLYDCYVPAEPLTLTEVFPHSLNVAFARNEAGIKILDAQKRKMRRRKALTERPGNATMRKNWEDDDEK